MKLELTNDICFFDLETTGLSVLRDRIVQIAVIKLFPDGTRQDLEMLINPTIPISEESMRIHGITPAMLVDKPIFLEVADQIHDFIGNADLGGYNCVRFDIPMLIEEFSRADIDFDIIDRKIIDVQRLFYKMEPRTLRAAYKFYCGNVLENAHDAKADVEATISVLESQLDYYKETDFIDEKENLVPAPVTNDIAKLHEFTNDLNIIDATQRLKYNDQGQVVFNFGKYIEKPLVDVFKVEPSYYNWILDKEFSHQVKQIVRKIYAAMHADKHNRA